MIFMDILKIESQIKSPYLDVILKISKSSKNDLKSDFAKPSIKYLYTLGKEIGLNEVWLGNSEFFYWLIIIVRLIHLIGQSRTTIFFVIL
jgi:hypothetical protein